MAAKKDISWMFSVFVVLTLVVTVSCGNSRTHQTDQTDKEIEYHIDSPNAVVTEENDSDLQKLSLRDIVEGDDEYYTIVNLDPTDGDYYFGDLAKAPDRGWYGSYGGEYVTVELNEIKYLDDKVRFVMQTFGTRLLDNGKVMQTEPDFYDVDLTRKQFIEAIRAYNAGETDAVIIEAFAVPVRSRP
jgi:hypothetical protein